MKFDFAVESFASEVNYAIAKAEPEARGMAQHVAALKESQAVLYGNEPPDAWIKQRDYYVELRALAEEAARVYQTVDDKDYRKYRNDLDDALDRRLRFRLIVATAWQDFAALLSKMISAVDAQKPPGSWSLRARLALRRLFSRRRVRK